MVQKGYPRIPLRVSKGPWERLDIKVDPLSAAVRFGSYLILRGGDPVDGGQVWFLFVLVRWVPSRRRARLVAI